MTTLLGLVFLLVTGPGFLALGIWMLRSGAWRDSVPLAEVVLDRVFGVEPPPRDKWDRRIAKFQAWFLAAIGLLTSLFYTTLFIIDLVRE